LMEADESGVISRQKAHRRELIDPEIERHRGHIVKTTGGPVGRVCERSRCGA
jgi:class 3 adenylate cyclase